jgi:hypothetical protein
MHSSPPSSSKCIALLNQDSLFPSVKNRARLKLLRPVPLVPAAGNPVGLGSDPAGFFMPPVRSFTSPARATAARTASACILPRCSTRPNKAGGLTVSARIRLRWDRDPRMHLTHTKSARRPSGRRRARAQGQPIREMCSGAWLNRLTGMRAAPLFTKADLTRSAPRDNGSHRANGASTITFGRDGGTNR